MKGNLTLLGSFPCSPQRRLRRCTLLPSVTAILISVRAWNWSRRRTIDQDDRNAGKSQAATRVRARCHDV